MNYRFNVIILIILEYVSSPISRVVAYSIATRCILETSTTSNVKWLPQCHPREAWGAKEALFNLSMHGRYLNLKGWSWKTLLELMWESGTPVSCKKKTHQGIKMFSLRARVLLMPEL